MADVNMDQIIDSLSNLTVMQIADLTKKLEDKWGVKAAPVAVPPPVVLQQELRPPPRSSRPSSP